MGFRRTVLWSEEPKADITVDLSGCKAVLKVECVVFGPFDDILWRKCNSHTSFSEYSM